VEGENGTVAALFYAEGSADLRKQVAIVGSVVGGNVHVQQVPRVLWHEDIVAMAEFMCLVGSVAIWVGPATRVSGLRCRLRFAEPAPEQHSRLCPLDELRPRLVESC
jgi:hypothetical protein